MKNQKILSMFAAIALMSGSALYAESGVAIEKGEIEGSIEPLLTENDGQRNALFGVNAGVNITANGWSNSFFGLVAGNRNTDGSDNVFMGDSTGYYNTSGSKNTFIGTVAGMNSRFEDDNTFIGYASGYNAQVSGSVYLGLRAGYDTTRDNTLYIANTSTSTPLIYGEFDSQKVGINGKLGVYTNSPSEMVEVKGINTAARFKLTSITNTANQAPQFIQQRARANGSNPAEVQSGDVIGLFSFRGWNGVAYTGTKAGITVTATEDWNTANNGNLVTLSHTPNGSTTLTPALQIKGHADVYIPNGNLYVKGSKMNVPDYVFKENYKLMPLNELKTFIKKNNHLPGVTSADEVGKAGVVNLSGLQMTLLEKVEELTLYTLQQEESLASKDAELISLATEMKEMKAKVAKLETMQKRLAKVESLLTNLALDTSNSKTEKVSLNSK